jgi:acyl-CoA reductase-like NAD-dependent aldehyde dehydrogenase
MATRTKAQRSASVKKAAATRQRNRARSSSWSAAEKTESAVKSAATRVSEAAREAAEAVKHAGASGRLSGGVRPSSE